MFVVLVFEFESVVEGYFHAFGPWLFVALGDTVEFPCMVFVADGVGAGVVVEVWWPVVVDGGAGVAGEYAKGIGAFRAASSVTEHEGQKAGAADVEPEAFSGEAKSGFVAADGFGCA